MLFRSGVAAEGDGPFPRLRGERGAQQRPGHERQGGQDGGHAGKNAEPAAADERGWGRHERSRERVWRRRSGPVQSLCADAKSVGGIGRGCRVADSQAGLRFAAHADSRPLTVKPYHPDGNSKAILIPASAGSDI